MRSTKIVVDTWSLIPAFHREAQLFSTKGKFGMYGLKCESWVSSESGSGNGKFLFVGNVADRAAASVGSTELQPTVFYKI